MKKHILLGAALLSLFAASCSNDDIINNDNEVVNGKTITLNATINNGADTRLAYTDNGFSMQVAWSSEESFTMYKGAITEGSTFSKTAESGSKFKGNDITGEGTYYAVYGGNHISNNNGTLTIDLSGAQVGTAADNGIKEFMLATADALTNETSLEFKHKLTVLKLTLTLPSDVTGPVNKVTVSGLHNKASYSLSADAYDAYADADKGDITATNGGTGFTIADNKITAYVAVFPESVTANQVEIAVNVGDNEYNYTIAGARTLAVGKVVPVNVSLVKVVQTNFKSAYIKDDYKTWSEDNCGSASYQDMRKYLGAGVYWDDGAEGENQQTYTLPNNKTYNAGLWLMKKAYIGPDVKENSYATPTKGRPAESDIDKYFFLPAAGLYINLNGMIIGIGDPGVSVYYWSSSPSGDANAHYLHFKDGDAEAYVASCPRGSSLCLPMVSE